jgi:putative ATP-dependent endonuclease of OLD family
MLEGLFARCVVLVEGRTESLSLPLLLEKAGLEAAREGVAVLPVGGKGNLGKWYRLFTAYGIPCYVVFDNDAADDLAGTKRRDALRAIGVPDGDRDAALAANGWLVDETHTIFGTDYETSLHAQFAEYAILAEAARDQGVETKPFVARWVAEHLPYNATDPGWALVEKMADALRALMLAA